MCNAWNHRAGCTCSWGRGVKTDSFTPIFGRSITHTYASFTVPNAKCPECKEPTFYYYNNNGSSVFFDQLGPPWTKHHCTDRSKVNQKLSTTGNQKKPVVTNQWEKDGWAILRIHNIKVIDKGIVEIRGKASTASETETWYMEAPIDIITRKVNFDTSSIAFIKDGNVEGVFVSILCRRGSVYETQVHKSLFYVHDAQDNKKKEIESEKRKIEAKRKRAWDAKTKKI